MAVMDEFKEEREAIKNATFKKRAEYFWDYYKIHTIVIVFSLFFLCAFAQSYLTAKDTVLYVAMINSYAETEAIDDIEADYLEMLDVNTKKYDVILSNTIFLNYEEQDTNHVYSVQSLVTLVAAGEVDILASEEATYVELAYQDIFMNLEELLTEEELAMYADRLFYVDQAVIDVINQLIDEYADESEYPDYVYGSNPEDMENPVAVGIYAEAGTTMTDTFYYYDDMAVIGVVANSGRTENAMGFVELMLE